MNRREALQRAGLVLGYAVSAPVLAGIMNGCKATPELTYKPVFFNEDQARIVESLAQIIIPKTDTGGAIEAGVPSFIDQVLKECYKKRDQDRYLESIKAFEEESKALMGESFIDLDDAKKLELATKLNKDAVESWRNMEGVKKKLMGQIYDEKSSADIQREYGAPEMATAPDSLELKAYFRTGNFNMTVDKQTNKIKEIFGSPDARHFFLTTKELTVSGFFTSQIGAEEVLQYAAVPGAFHGCLPLSEVGKAWATS